MPQDSALLPRYEHLYINGEWVTPIDGELVESIDPATGRPWAIAPLGGARDIDRAVEAARRAFPAWSRKPGHERAALLRRLADLFAAAIPELAVIESHDNGNLVREHRASLTAQVQWYQWFASLADKAQGTTIPIDDSVHAFTTRVPVGVVGAIIPWNAPLLATCLKVGAALAAGCTLVVKPAESTPVSALVLARLVHEAGFPPGVFNVVPGHGRTAGQRLVEHPDVDKVSFTGSTATARRMVRDGADNLKRFTFELGGKAPHILFADADIDNAINAATASAWRLTGQSCALGSRVLVERSIYDRVVEAFRERAKAVRVGLPWIDANHMGPQAHQQQLDKTLSYIQYGKEDGAELVTGGRRIDTPELAAGYFVEPTVFAGVDNGMRIARDEIFGPVASLIPFDGEDEAIAIANDTPYGLTAGLWTRDVGRAHRVSSRIEAGMVWVNTYSFLRWSTPYGGFKASGWGRENGIDALDPYLETRTTVISTTGQFPNLYV
ncbi:aldehyde dehydrogenase [Alicycliphilus denitrificans]|uniref:4-(hydroxymethyl)benzenesulfonate dehydrogenase n=2 Tax=Alicycliphilus denitrificans TaxID=179636 RepID=F4GFJ4_ALIDK|nr:aldehyde dehydrogenase [Alicycliphilus denitrificans]ADV00645.1 Aldehyde Dehydrogenase [Alicycliphilus denitrificans BC]AEB83926.1 Aldehyde Dehydrogenase [Alicycliphilus denitrificans K601]QKD44774.1 aldehyde dehydrogenase [Alicycliphilus denitrificans]GAO24141.1 aldehyde dehydrogenase [Alicycliphilus sp. B1]